MSSETPFLTLPPKANLEEVGAFTSEEEDEALELEAESNLQDLYEDYLEMSEDDDLHVRKIYDRATPFFNNMVYDKKSSQKRIFNVCISPLKKLCHNASVKRNFLKFYACAIYRYVEQDFDWIGAICGLEGTGKSNASLYLKDLLVELGMSFDLENDIFFRGDASPQGFGKAWKSISEQKKHVIIFDEGKAFFDKRQSMNAIRIEMLQELTSQRSKNHVMFINVGDISEIDVYFRDRRCRSILEIPDRRIGINLMNKGIIGMGGDRFGLDYFNYQLNYVRDISYMQQISMLYGLSTQYGIGTIPHVSESDYIAYKEMKDQRNSIIDKKREKMIMKGELTALGFSRGSVNTYIKNKDKKGGTQYGNLFEEISKAEE
jgi:hypothetical protein